MIPGWHLGLAANAFTAAALMVAAWRGFQARRASAFLLLAVGCVHWLHASVLAFPNLYSPRAGDTARLLFSDWRLYAFESVMGLFAIVYMVYGLQSSAEGAAQARSIMAVRQEHARSIQDGIVQSLAVAKMAMERGDIETAHAATDRALSDAKHLISRWRLPVETRHQREIPSESST